MELIILIVKYDIELFELIIRTSCLARVLGSFEDRSILKLKKKTKGKFNSGPHGDRLRTSTQFQLI